MSEQARDAMLDEHDRDYTEREDRLRLEIEDNIRDRWSEVAEKHIKSLRANEDLTRAIDKAKACGDAGYKRVETPF